MSQTVNMSKPSAPLRQVHSGLLSGLRELLEIARCANVRTGNGFMKGTLMP